MNGGFESLSHHVTSMPEAPEDGDDEVKDSFLRIEINLNERLYVHTRMCKRKLLYR